MDKMIQNQDLFARAFELMFMPVAICDTEGTFQDCNDAFCTASGYSREELIGKKSRDLDLWAEPEAFNQIKNELKAKGRIDDMELRIKRRDGKIRLMQYSAHLLTLEPEPLILSVSLDITDHRVAEEKVKALLTEKELILKEVHHRIKNYMSTIRSLLSLQAGTLTDTSAIQALEDAESRVQSMALLYDKLYCSADFNEISVINYLPVLIDEIIANFPNSSAVQVEKKIGDFLIGAKKMQPLGIIVNELLTNIMKYAFQGRSDGKIIVTALLDGEKVSLTIEDNGNGIPEHVDFKNTTGFGFVLVNALIHQLGGEIHIDRNGGTKVMLTFKR